MIRIGVLGLQGDFDAHRRAMEEAGASDTIVVRHPGELDDIDALIIPGGESTTLLKLMSDLDFEEPIRSYHASGRPIFGTCAGAILLASNVTEPAQPSLGLIDIDVQRNAYGRQNDSFETRLARPNPPRRSSGRLSGAPRSTWSSSGLPGSSGAAPRSASWCVWGKSRSWCGRGWSWPAPFTPK